MSFQNDTNSTLRCIRYEELIAKNKVIHTYWGSCSTGIVASSTSGSGALRLQNWNIYSITQRECTSYITKNLVFPKAHTLIKESATSVNLNIFYHPSLPHTGQADFYAELSQSCNQLLKVWQQHNDYLWSYLKIWWNAKGLKLDAYACHPLLPFFFFFKFNSERIRMQEPKRLFCNLRRNPGNLFSFLFFFPTYLHFKTCNPKNLTDA